MEEPSPEEQEQWNLAQIRQRRSRLTAKPIGSVVRRLMTQSGYGQTQAVQVLREKWAEAVGPTLAPRSSPGNLTRGVLQVHVADSATMQELSFCKRQIIQSLRSALPDSNITDIRPRVGTIS